MGTVPSYAVPALEKGMRILEDLAASPSPLSLAELAEQQGRGRNEIYRMVNCLESLGYIIRENGTKRYGLTLKLYQLANHHPPLERLCRVAEQPLRNLADQIQESCHLCLLDRESLIVAAQADGNERIRIVFQIGARFDPLDTCSGKVLTSSLGPERRKQVLHASETWQNMGTGARKRLTAQLEKMRKQGFWEEESKLRRGIRDIAVSLGSPTSLHATVAVPHLIQQKEAETSERILHALRQTASEIELALGRL